MIYSVIFLVTMFIAYNCLVFKFVDSLLENPRLNNIYYIPVAIINTIVAVGLTVLSGSTSFFSYIIIGLVLLVEFTLFHKEKVLRCMFCMLACLIHIMAIRSLCVAGFALASHSTFYDIVNDPNMLILSTAFTFFILDIIDLAVIRFVPAKKIKIINQHMEQLCFMVGLLVVFCTYLLINSKAYSTPNTHPTLLQNQILAPLTVLIGTYIVLFYTIKTSSLLGYKEKNEELQHTVEKERQYRTSMDKVLFRSAEVDFTNDIILSGFEDYAAEVDFAELRKYSEIFPMIVQSVVHPEDHDKFTECYDTAAMVRAFEQGITEIAFDYRRMMPTNTYQWMNIFIALVRDPESNSVKGFLRIKNIDEEKLQQLELQYKAERDLLTGLYNKGTAEAMITKRLNSEKANGLTGAIFIIDIDNFKTINDSLGHLYGDVVLSELSEGLRNAFREEDIVGRIGGDEFIVFAEGLISKAKIQKKAEKICSSFLRTYSNEKNEGYTVSSSVGIAVFPQDGVAFETLFKCADSALYTTKARGKNGYSFYEKDQTMPYVSTRTEIDTHGIIQKRFKDNRIEYVFRLLYGSEDTKVAIESMMELIAKNFGFSRANIFEFNELSTHFNGVFEWCDINIASVSDNYINMPVSSFDFIVSALEKSGGMFMAVPTDFPEFAQESYTSIGIKSIVHFSIKERDKLLGVIAFQNCTNDHFSISDTEFEELRTLCQVLSVFMAKRLSNEREQRHHQAVEAIVDNMNSIAYVVDRETFEVFYENQNVIDITGHPSIGIKCHVSYRGLDEPCPDCPLQHLSEKHPRCTLELYTEKFDIYTKTSAALINWSNDRKSLLISSVDVTEYK